MPARQAGAAAWEPSIFDRQTLPDLVDPFLERVEPGVQGAVVEVKNITERGKAEDPVVAFDVSEHRLDRVTDKGDRAQQSVHRTPPLTGNDLPIANRIGLEQRSFPLTVI